MDQTHTPRVNAAGEVDPESVLSAQVCQRAARPPRRAARWSVLATFLHGVWHDLDDPAGPRLPDPTATHRNFAGEPDDLGSPWVNVIGIAVVSLFLTALFRLQARVRVDETGIKVRSAAAGRASCSCGRHCLDCGGRDSAVGGVRG